MTNELEAKAPFRYLRFREPPYTDRAIKRIADDVRPLLANGIEVYAYFSHEKEPTAPQYAKRLLAHVAPVPEPSQPKRKGRLQATAVRYLDVANDNEGEEGVMAELTTLEEKLGEVTGLAMAAQGATEKVSGLVEDDELKQTLDRMNAEAKETEERCTKLAEELDGKKTAVLEKARETKQEATEMMRTYLGSDAEGLDGFEFLTMAEAGEVGHWEVLGVLG